MMDQNYNFSNTFNDVEIKNEDTFEYYCDIEGDRGEAEIICISMKILCLGHSKFTTSSIFGPKVFHFMTNKSDPERKFKFRVFPIEPVFVIFSNTKTLDNHTITFELSHNESIVYENGNKNKTSDFFEMKYGDINDYYIDFSTSHIDLNKRLEITGDFQFLQFIAFNSSASASWIVQESMKTN